MQEITDWELLPFGPADRRISYDAVPPGEGINHASWPKFLTTRHRGDRLCLGVKISGQIAW